MKTAFLYTDKYFSYDYGVSHPLRVERLQLTYDLSKAYNLFQLPHADLVETRPASESELLRFHTPDYVDVLKNGLIRPSKLEIYIMNLKDRKPIQLTNNGAANFGPYFHPGGEKVIFASNMDDPKKRNFDLHMVDIKTKKVERLTYNPTFDGFPMFSHDGRKLVFASNRNNSRPHETNMFIADWIE